MPRLLRFSLVSVLVTVAALSLLRLAFFLEFRDPALSLAPALAAEAFRVGLKFDLRLALLLHLPLLTLGALPWFSPFRSLGRRRAWVAYFAVASCAVLVLYALDFGHYGYLQLRLDATILRFLYEPAISAQMIWDTYPVPEIVLAIAIGVAAAGWAAGRGFEKAGARTGSSRRGAVLSGVLAAALIAAGLWGKLQWYPLRWADAYFSASQFASTVALNPVLYFAATWKNRARGWDEPAAREVWPLVRRHVGAPPAPAGALTIDREGIPAWPRTTAPNVVLVILESFAAFKTGYFGNPLDPTPHFDALARESVVFTRFYTPHTGTARSVFASLTGLPDVERVRTSSRNPLAVRQHTIVNDFVGYDKYFFMGGSANWGNIRGLLANNVPDLRLYEEGDHHAPRVNVWGISDLQLFEEALSVLRERGDGPFFAVVKTSGSHRPYTIPPDTAFRMDPRTDAEARAHGFASNAEYNAFRYLDHSLGRFLALARREPWYANTIFVFFGDHGLGARAIPHVSPAERQLELTKLHVPLVIHAPALMGPPRELPSVASGLDLLPTVASAAGRRYLNTTLGSDLFDPHRSPYAFTIRHGGEPTIGVVSRDYWFQMRADGTGAALNPLTGEDPDSDVSARFPEEARRMRELARALHESARWLTFHNAPQPALHARVEPGD